MALSRQAVVKVQRVPWMMRPALPFVLSSVLLWLGCWSMLSRALAVRLVLGG